MGDLCFQGTLADQLPHSGFALSELAEDDLPGHRTIEHPLRIRFKGFQYLVETVMKVPQNMIMIGGKPML
ncbi:hypothetical protein GCM10023353_20110 [Tomitella cavernea]|uniref:Uncharacterized protein n=1 Tax=Tomitella cavernea TaxID=1387982 RepID=A0ABP9CQH0_9ACTN